MVFIPCSFNNEKRSCSKPNHARDVIVQYCATVNALLNYVDE